MDLQGEPRVVTTIPPCALHSERTGLVDEPTHEASACVEDLDADGAGLGHLIGNGRGWIERVRRVARPTPRPKPMRDPPARDEASRPETS
jgi:hypothetical protein